jgi:hypothetical protein
MPSRQSHKSHFAIDSTRKSDVLFFNDSDEQGNVCDPDDDNDVVLDDNDNCQFVENPDQYDCDGDGAGDLCVDDYDDDGVPDLGDLCPDSSLGNSVGGDDYSG